MRGREVGRYKCGQILNAVVDHIQLDVPTQLTMTSCLIVYAYRKGLETICTKDHMWVTEFLDCWEIDTYEREGLGMRLWSYPTYPGTRVMETLTDKLASET